MANRRMEFLIGMTVLVIFIAVAVMTVLFGPEQGMFVRRGGQRMMIVFDNASGLTNNSRVVKSGVEIGRVYSRELRDCSDKNEVLVKFELNADAKIYSNEYAKINRSILGEAAIEFVKNPNYLGEVTEVAAEKPIQGKPGGDLAATVNNIEGDLAKTLQTVTNAAAGLSLFMENINSFLGTPDELQEKKIRLQNIFSELNSTLVSVRSMVTNMDSIVADTELHENIRKGASQIPDILTKFENLTANTNGLISNATTLADDIRLTIDRSHRSFEQLEKNLDNIGVFTESLADNGPEFITALTDSSKDLQGMIQNIGELAQQLNKQISDPNSTLAMLADPQITNSVRDVINNSKMVTETLAQKLPPIMDDTRTFSNKVAHRPSSLLFSRETYKGNRTETNNQYGLQPLTPSGGVSSPLYQPNQPMMMMPPQQVALAPNSLSAYYQRNPAEEMFATSATDKKSCSLVKKQGCLFTASKDPEVDTQNYFGTSFVSDLSLDQMVDDGFPTGGNFALQRGEQVPTGGPPPQVATSANKMQFSLRNPFGKVFSSRQVAQKENTPTMNPGDFSRNVVSYPPENYSPAPVVSGNAGRLSQDTLLLPSENNESLPASINRPAKATHSFADDGLPIQYVQPIPE